MVEDSPVEDASAEPTSTTTTAAKASTPTKAGGGKKRGTKAKPRVLACMSARKYPVPSAPKSKRAKAAAATPKAPKEKKPKATRAPKPKASSDHPKTSAMVTDAIRSLNERSGSSLKAIKKYIGDTYNLDAEKFAPFIRKYIKSAVDSGALVQVKGVGANGSFKMAVKGKGDSPRTKAKAAATKKKTGTKKAKTASPKKSATPKKKPASKSKPKGLSPSKSPEPESGPESGSPSPPPVPKPAKAKKATAKTKAKSPKPKPTKKKTAPKAKAGGKRAATRKK